MRRHLARGLLWLCALAIVGGVVGCDQHGRCCRVNESYCGAPGGYQGGHGQSWKQYRGYRNCD